MVLTMTAGVLAQGACSGSCLLALEDDCSCRCGGRFHGLLAETPIVVDPDVRVSTALADEQDADDDATEAVRMRAAGMSYGVIGAHLGRSKSWAYYTVNPREIEHANGSAA